MTAARLALTELRRLTCGRLPRLALVAMLVVPTLYGGLYLYANKDPYAGLAAVPAAIVVEDAGTTLANGERLDSGPKLPAIWWHRAASTGTRSTAPRRRQGWRAAVMTSR